jgi:hypothetical protein
MALICKSRPAGPYSLDLFDAIGQVETPTGGP